MACKKSRYDVFSISQSDIDHIQRLLCSIKYANIDEIRQLIALKYDYSLLIGLYLPESVFWGHLNIVKYFIEDLRIDPRIYGYRLLYIAFINDHKEIIDYLTEVTGFKLLPSWT